MGTSAEGWSIDAIEDIDGFGIEGVPDEEGEIEIWMCAADVPYVTRYTDAALELIFMSRADAAASICADALRSLANSGVRETDEDFTSRAARWLVLALLRSISSEHSILSIGGGRLRSNLAELRHKGARGTSLVHRAFRPHENRMVDLQGGEFPHGGPAMQYRGTETSLFRQAATLGSRRMAASLPPTRRSGTAVTPTPGVIPSTGPVTAGQSFVRRPARP